MMPARRTTQEELWRHTREPIKAPLLQKLQRLKEPFEQAVAIFNLILKVPTKFPSYETFLLKTFIPQYMGDLPRGKTKINTDLIFEPAQKNEMLRDEVYCQIMKQLTDNRIQISEERGWELMWLATGVMLPTPALLKELLEFLKTRNNDLAVESLNRLQKTMRIGERQHPPYIIEVEAIKYRTMQIYHKVWSIDC